MQGEERREKEAGSWEYLIVGCILIQEVKNVSEKHISDLLSVRNSADRQQECSQASHTRSCLAQLVGDQTG